jgi:hypothetical protein
VTSWIVPFVQRTKDDPLNHTNSHEPKHSCLELDPTFEAKQCDVMAGAAEATEARRTFRRPRERSATGNFLFLQARTFHKSQCNTDCSIMVTHAVSLHGNARCKLAILSECKGFAGTTAAGNLKARIGVSET